MTKTPPVSYTSNADLFGDNVIHHFGCAAADAVEPDVAISTLHLVLAEIAPTAVQLQAIVNDAAGGFGGEGLGHGHFPQAAHALRDPPGAGIDELPRRLELRVTLGEALPGDLQIGQMPGAINALFDEMPRLIKTGLGGAYASGGNHEPFGLETLHDLIKTAVLAPQKSVAGQPAAVECQVARVGRAASELAVHFFDLEAGRIALDQKHA